LLDDGKIRIRDAQKHTDPTDREHCLKLKIFVVPLHKPYLKDELGQTGKRSGSRNIHGIGRSLSTQFVCPLFNAKKKILCDIANIRENLLVKSK
jgi:hypothetical protein